jgi:hypothetical protein
MLNSLSIKEIALDATGRLMVRPAYADSSFQFIYRAGNGLRWQPGSGSFVAAEPLRWNATELLPHILSTVRDELGVKLHLTAQTQWVNVPAELELELRKVFETDT